MALALSPAGGTGRPAAGVHARSSRRHDAGRARLTAGHAAGAAIGRLHVMASARRTRWFAARLLPCTGYCHITVVAASPLDPTPTINRPPPASLVLSNFGATPWAADKNRVLGDECEAQELQHGLALAPEFGGWSRSGRHGQTLRRCGFRRGALQGGSICPPWNPTKSARLKPASTSPVPPPSRSVSWSVSPGLQFRDVLFSWQTFLAVCVGPPLGAA